MSIERHWKVYMSHRAIPLVYMEDPLDDFDVLTVENYQKWYGLHLVQPSGKIIEIPFPMDAIDCEGDIPFYDHVPNPRVVERFAKRMKHVVDDQALEMISGRWLAEVVGRDMTSGELTR